MTYSPPSAITARSPSARFFGGSAGRLDLHYLLLGELLKITPAEIARELLGGGHDGARVAGMRLDDLADPFGIEQVVETLGRLLGLHQAGVVGNGRERQPPRGIHAVG